MTSTEPDVLGLAAGWWARGLSLTERRAARPAAPAGAGGPDTSAGAGRPETPAGTGTPVDPALRRAERRLAAWRTACDGYLDLRLAVAGLDEPRLLALLAQPPEDVAAAGGEPPWARYVAEALGGPTATTQAGFARILAPLVHRASADLPEVPRALADCFARHLSGDLTRLARRTLVLELNVLRLTGKLAGETPQERFADFVGRLSTPDHLGTLLAEWPVLARILAGACDAAVAAWSELAARLAADRGRIVADLLGGVDPGPLVDVDMAAGDSHRRGRRVAVLRFADGARVVYKPRPLAAHAHFNDVLAWTNAALPGLDLRTLAVADRGPYGWMEFAVAGPCADLRQVDAFYRRLGALLALLHALDGTDIHYENLLACADQPVVVDVETLFHPAMPADADDPAARALESSVYRIALLPHLLIGDHGALDISGVGGDKGAASPNGLDVWADPGTDEMRLTREPAVFPGADNRPRLDGADVEPESFGESILAGFREAYQVISERRAELTRLVGRFGADEMRVVLRATRRYTTLLDESTHPDLLRDALDRDRFLDALWPDSADDPVRWSAVRHELADLWAGDVPYFTHRPAGRQLLAGDGTPVADLAESGLERVAGKLAAMRGVDQYDQEWVIQASLAVRTPMPEHRPGPPRPAPAPRTPVGSERLLAAACGIGDQLLAMAHTDGHRVNWLGMEAVDADRWGILPQRAGLVSGHSGTALFLAHLSELTGIARYAELASQAVRPVPGLLAGLAAHPEYLALSGSGLHGPAGLAYALTHLAALWNDREIAGWVERAVALCDPALVGAPGPGLLTGAAGNLAALVAVHEATGLDHARKLATSWAPHLRDRLPATGGMAFGAAGVGWALARHGERPEAASLLLRAGRPEPAADGNGTAGERDTSRTAEAAGTPGTWCDGTPGIALALVDLGLRAPLVEDAIVDAARPVAFPDDCLCHGDTGRLELLLVAATAGHPVAVDALPRRAGAFLAGLDRHGPRCSTPGAVPSPGLFGGLAGIGYGLLRLAFPARVPSVPLLRTPTSPSPHRKDTG
ncbi:type 2 lanthipeptide synthetase LanM family protein [Longispora fulva]|uniref:Type 2 lantibiotic biosynthesis protein LanM n=1 Tax=Longispora fulva TaxID=619741 RepID=A0A8J7GAW9_9ACTN|nr:type 2 lanthipeptide synthetase LanM family protein [Longispora fulva]MBG6137013.1 type 2 lantibiotic biosynthesis protein LanM [Longispora fulva]